MSSPNPTAVSSLGASAAAQAQLAAAQAQVNAAQAAADKQPITAFGWVLAWVVVVLILGAVNRTRLGHAFLYYVFALFLLFLIVVNYFWIASALAPFRTLAGAQPSSTSSASTSGVSTAAAQAGTDAASQAAQGQAQAQKNATYGAGGGARRVNR